MQEQCCGDCARFAFEDACGYGWCLAMDREKLCDEPACESHETESGSYPHPIEK